MASQTTSTGSGAGLGSATRHLGNTAATALAPAVWGTTYLVTTEFLPAGQPLWSAAIRALPAGLLLLAITRTLPRGGWWWRAGVLGTLNIGAFLTLLFVAAYRLPGGLAATVIATQPLLVAGLAWVLLAERPTRWRLGWGITGVLGVAMMVLREQVHLDLLGIGAAVAAAIVMATGIVLTRRWSRPVGVWAFTGWQLTAGGLVITVLAALTENPPSSLDLAALAGYAWLAIPGALLAYGFWFRGIGRLPVTAVSFLGLLSPVVATGLGWLVLGQSLTLIQTLGFLVALVSILTAQLPPATIHRIGARRSERTAILR